MVSKKIISRENSLYRHQKSRSRKNNITYIINIIFISGRQAALERVASLRKGNNIESHTVVVGVESFLYEVTEGL